MNSLSTSNADQIFITRPRNNCVVLKLNANRSHFIQHIHDKTRPLSGDVERSSDRHSEKAARAQ
jgi:hypothetical protein